MGRRGYPPELRRKVLDLVEAGRPVADVAKALGISDQSIYTWRRQDRIDRGLLPGLTSGEKAEQVAAWLTCRIPPEPGPIEGRSDSRLGVFVKSVQELHDCGLCWQIPTLLEAFHRLPGRARGEELMHSSRPGQ